MMLIFAIIFTGIVLVLPPYVQESSDTLLITAVRDGASHAATYLNIGVLSEEPVYLPLNRVIEDYTNYQDVDFRFAGIGVESSNSTEVTISLVFVHGLPPNATRDSNIARAIGDFLKGYLTGVKGFSLNGGHLYYGGHLVKFKITVDGSEVVVW